jgi:hypothetical protein
MSACFASQAASERNRLWGIEALALTDERGIHLSRCLQRLFRRKEENRETEPETGCSIISLKS